MKTLFYDHGNNLHLALEFAAAGHQVTYHVPRSTKYYDSAFGRGYTRNNVVKVDDFFKALEYSEMMFFFGDPSHFDGDLIDWLRAKGHKVFGAGERLERMERDRWYAMERMQAMGLPTPRSELVRGVRKLMSVLENAKDKLVVKVSAHRDVETFKHDDWASTLEQHVPKLLTAYGTDPDVEFVVQEQIEGESLVEIGSDDVIVNGSPAKHRCFGYEDKDNAYIGKIVDDTNYPRALKTSNRLLTTYDTASTFFSVEYRGKYPIDITMRTPKPPGPAMSVGYRNLPDYLVHGGELKVNHQFCGSVVLYSNYNIDHPVKVTVKGESRVGRSQSSRFFLKLNRSYMNSSGDEFVAPNPDGLLGWMTHSADGLLELVHGLKFAVEQVSAKDINYNLSSLDTIVDKTIPMGRLNGYAF